MKSAVTKNLFAAALMAVALLTATMAQAADPLPSWNDGKAKQAITAFVTKVSREGSPDFVPVAECIATFDNDGTLWAEQPMYFQTFFIFDRIKALAPQHPEWKTKEPFAAVLKGDVGSALAGGEHALMEMAMATHAGMTTDAFEKIVTDWIASAKHPKTGHLFTEMVYQPMLELREGKPEIVRLAEINFIDDKAGKPVGIQQYIGRRPIAAFGNSDGDLQMLQWTKAGPGPRLALYIHHTDAVREWAYDRESSVGRLDQGLDEARTKGWTVVDMQQDWKVIFPFERR